MAKQGKQWRLSIQAELARTFSRDLSMEGVLGSLRRSVGALRQLRGPWCFAGWLALSNAGRVGGATENVNERDRPARARRISMHGFPAHDNSRAGPETGGPIRFVAGAGDVNCLSTWGSEGRQRFSNVDAEFDVSTARRSTRHGTREQSSDPKRASARLGS